MFIKFFVTSCQRFYIILLIDAHGFFFILLMFAGYLYPPLATLVHLSLCYFIVVLIWEQCHIHYQFYQLLETAN